MFEASFDSLLQYQCPDWFRDVKSASELPARRACPCLATGTPAICIFRIRSSICITCGTTAPSKFGYKDICALWKAENFDPDGLMALYHKAGARYFVAQAMHHDHFFNYPSQINRMNAMQVGPKKDICGLWKQAAKKYGMPFGLTEHLGASSPGGA